MHFKIKLTKRGRPASEFTPEAFKVDRETAVKQLKREQREQLIRLRWRAHQRAVAS